MTCRILVPQPGIEPAPPTLGVQSQPLGHQGTPLTSVFAITYCILKSAVI